MARFVVGISGASGIILAKKLVESFTDADHDVDLVMSQHAVYTASLELGKEYASPQKFVDKIPQKKRVTLHPIQDIGSAICSGTHLHNGMVIVPCSMATIAAITIGLSDNGLRRAADVTLKEKRPLILVPRETPLSEIHLENMLKLSRMGVSILPPMPAWYQGHQTLGDMENFIVGKILDLLGVSHNLYKRWS